MKQGVVYVIESDAGTVKVGATTRPGFRKMEIEGASGFRSKNYYKSEFCANYFQVERAEHEKLSAYRKQGEWFYCGFEAAVNAVKESFSENASFEIKEDIEWDFEDTMAEFFGFKITKTDHANVTGEMAIEKLSEFNGEQFGINDFQGEIGSLEELDELDDIKERREKYPKLFSGIEDHEELCEYALDTYYTLLHSSFSSFAG